MEGMAKSREEGHCIGLHSVCVSTASAHSPRHWPHHPNSAAGNNTPPLANRCKQPIHQLPPTNRLAPWEANNQSHQHHHHHGIAAIPGTLLFHARNHGSCASRHCACPSSGCQCWPDVFRRSTGPNLLDIVQPRGRHSGQWRDTTFAANRGTLSGQCERRGKARAKA